MWKAFVLIAVLDGVPFPAVADDTPAKPVHHLAIPDEAYAACKDLSEGDTCIVTLKDKQLAGVCQKSHQDERLFCLPPPPHPQQGPSPHQ